MVELGGGLSALTNVGLSAPTRSRVSCPTCVVFSFLPEDASPCLMVVDQSGSEGYANLSVPVSSDPASASGSPSVALPVISSPSSTLSRSIAINSSSKEQLLGHSRRMQGYNKQQAVPRGHKSKEELLKSRQKVTVEEKKSAKNLFAAPGKKYANIAIAPSASSNRAWEKVLEFWNGLPLE
jgi:hypothetical protein